MTSIFYNKSIIELSQPIHKLICKKKSKKYPKKKIVMTVNINLIQS